jgi:hypothetical protein
MLPEAAAANSAEADFQGEMGQGFGILGGRENPQECRVLGGDGEDMGGREGWARVESWSWCSACMYYNY